MDHIQLWSMKKNLVIKREEQVNRRLNEGGRKEEGNLCKS